MPAVVAPTRAAAAPAPGNLAKLKLAGLAVRGPVPPAASILAMSTVETEPCRSPRSHALRSR